jgi:hypothetical protein
MTAVPKLKLAISHYDRHVPIREGVATPKRFDGEVVPEAAPPRPLAQWNWKELRESRDAHELLAGSGLIDEVISAESLFAASTANS